MVDVRNELYATGDMYLQINPKTWGLRKFVVVGTELSFFDSKGEKKGQFDLIGAKFKKLSADDVKFPLARYCIGLFGTKATWYVCALSDSDRDVWVETLNVQIEEFKDENRKFLNSNEWIHGGGIVKKSSKFGAAQKVKMLITNFPRLLYIDVEAQTVKEVVKWKPDAIPVLKFVRSFIAIFILIQIINCCL